MANQTNSLSHTKWVCKYHIVFVPKYRRKIIYNQYRADLQEIIRTLCKYKGVEILEGHMMPDHVHLLLSIPPKTSVSSFMGYLKGKSALTEISLNLTNGSSDIGLQKFLPKKNTFSISSLKKRRKSLSQKMAFFKNLIF